MKIRCHQHQQRKLYRTMTHHLVAANTWLHVVKALIICIKFKATVGALLTHF